jgi:hypothetical protein
VTRNRNLAIQVLDRWPRESRPADAETLLREAFWKEPVANVRERLSALADGCPLPD